MGRRLQRIGRDEIVVFEEIATHLRRKEDDRGEHHQEQAQRINVMHGVERMERDAVERATL